MFYLRKHQLNRRITSIQLKQPIVDSLDIWLELQSALLSPRDTDQRQILACRLNP